MLSNPTDFFKNKVNITTNFTKKPLKSKKFNFTIRKMFIEPKKNTITKINLRPNK